MKLLIIPKALGSSCIKGQSQILSGKVTEHGSRHENSQERRMFAVCEKGLRPCMSIFRSPSKTLSSKLSSKHSTSRSESVLSLAKYMSCKFYYLFISFVFLGHPRHKMGIISQTGFWVDEIRLLSLQEKGVLPK